MLMQPEGYDIKLITGVDEVGVGCCAGPLIACAVIIHTNSTHFNKVKDSKLLYPKTRQKIYKDIKHWVYDYKIGLVTPAEVDELNPLQASKEAMYRAVKKLKLNPEFILVDAHIIPYINNKQMAVPKGDRTYIPIAAASIIAKEYRDRLMARYAVKYPNYEFEKNKGYCTKEHKEHLNKYGPCPIHRYSYGPVQKGIRRK